ncbi:hypothetical protein GCM10009759_41830 [Kitasatospora saccharophila]|uniref:Uncharacterized protein n=1 Tax=Kitasatospora saccharophila TaxID=407973 RepID=A0ABN2X4U7_9ACTN
MSVRLPEELAALREPLSDWAARQHSDMVVTVGEDHGLDHGRLCWDALRAVDLIGPACWCPRPGRHSSPHDDRLVHERLRVRVPAADALTWMTHTLGQNLVHTHGNPPGRRARELAEPLVALLGPDADWRANGYAAHPAPAGHNRSWGSVTPFTFDAALVGIGNGRTVVAVATGED